VSTKFNSFDQSPLGAFRESPLGARNSQTPRPVPEWVTPIIFLMHGVRGYAGQYHEHLWTQELGHQWTSSDLTTFESAYDTWPELYDHDLEVLREVLAEHAVYPYVGTRPNYRIALWQTWGPTNLTEGYSGRETMSYHTADFSGGLDRLVPAGRVFPHDLAVRKRTPQLNLMPLRFWDYVMREIMVPPPGGVNWVDFSISPEGYPTDRYTLQQPSLIPLFEAMFGIQYVQDEIIIHTESHIHTITQPWWIAFGPHESPLAALENWVRESRPSPNDVRWTHGGLSATSDWPVWAASTIRSRMRP